MVPASWYSRLYVITSSWVWQAWDLILPNRIQQRWQDICDYMYMIILHKTVTPVLRKKKKKTFSPLLTWKKQAATFVCPHIKKRSKELRIASGQKTLPPTIEWDSKSSSLQRTEFCQEPHKFGGRFIPNQTSRETAFRTNPLIAGLRFWSRGSC